MTFGLKMNPQVSIKMADNIYKDDIGINMNSLIKSLILLLCTQIAIAGCDLTKFRWGCSIYPKVKSKRTLDSLIYCGSTRLYVSREQFNLIRHYQSAGVHMSIKVNDVYYDGPCVADRHNMHHQKLDKISYF